MKIAIGNDHAALEAKRALLRMLAARGDEVVNVGTDEETSTDYPDQAAVVGRLVAAGEVERGILLCGTAIGMSIAANKIRGVRAAVVHSIATATLARAHNDANVVCLGSRVLDESSIETCTLTFLTTDFAGGRHARRVAKITALERG